MIRSTRLLGVIRCMVRSACAWLAIGISLTVPGCAAGLVGAILGVLSITGNGGGQGEADVPSILGMKVLEGTAGSGRADDLRRVRISFGLAQRTPAQAAVEVEYSPAGSTGPWAQASILERTADLGTSPSGQASVLTWDAAADGLRGFARVDLRLTARDLNGQGTQASLDGVPLGNEPPRSSAVAVVFPAGAAAASGTVAVKFELSDSAGDRMRIDFLVSTDGGKSFGKVPPEHILGGETEGLLPGRKNLTWDTVATLGRTNLEGVVVAVEPDDGLHDGQGDRVASTPFPVFNNSPPQVSLVEPAINPDGDGPILLHFRLKDEEGDPADVVLQWSADRSFPPLADLADPEARRRVLADPDERAPRRIITVRARTLAEAQCYPVPELAPDEVRLGGIKVPLTLTPANAGGGTLELLADGGAVEEIGEIASYGPLYGQVRLRRPLGRPPLPGQRARVKEGMLRLFVDLESSREALGKDHFAPWDAPADVGIGSGDARYYLRATAFTGSRLASTSTSTIGKEVRTDRLSFIKGEALSTGREPVSLAAADLDLDGKLDLVTADKGGAALSVFLGKGDGAFLRRPGAPVYQGDSPRSVIAADLTSDAAADLVVTDSDFFHVLVNDGRGSFQETVSWEFGGTPVSAIATDMNGDGIADLVSIQSNGISIALGEGEGDFQPVQDLPAAGPVSLAAGDLDGDGAPDLIVAIHLAIAIFRGNGDGSLRPEAFPLNLSHPPTAVTLGDLNDDGQLDLVAAEEDVATVETVSVYQLSTFLGNGLGGYPATPSSVLRSGISPRAILTADLNGDGRLDLVSADAGSNHLSLFLGLGDGSFVEPAEPTLETGKGPSALGWGDFNGDAIPDLASADSSADQVSVFLGSGAWGFPAKPRSFRLESPRAGVAVGDLDGDGVSDLIFSEGGINDILIFLGTGDGDYASAPILSTGLLSWIVTPGDLNGDGRLDLTVVTPSIELFLGKGIGATFEPKKVLDNHAYLIARPADVDLDGLPDLVGINDLSLSVLTGTGGGSFRPPVSVTHPSRSINDLGLADLDRDGVPEVISVSNDPGYLAISQGNRDFKVTPRFPVGAYPYSFAVADLDGDGALDLITSNISSSSMTVVLQPASGKPSITTYPGNLSSPVLAADFNGDGFTDLILSEIDEFSLYLGRGDGTFSRPASRTIVDVGINWAALSDLDGDGLPDMVSVEPGQRRFTVFTSGARGPVPASFFGVPRAISPSFGNARGRNLRLAARARPYRVNTTTGTIDGRRSEGFQGRSFHFASIAIDTGATVVTDGEEPLTLLATGEVRIEGSLLSGGEDARDAGTDGNRTQNRGTAGGRGGPGGAAGGAGGGTVPGNGLPGGSRGGGSGGADGGAAGLSASPGGGGSFGTRGVNGRSPYGNHLLNPLFGGSGGGGGGIRDADGKRSLNSGDDGGAGGGGGGGAVRITAGGDILVSGAIGADGGRGGRGYADRGGHGGGGSGGSILLQARGKIAILSGGRVTATGGAGGRGEGSPAGGDGGDGRLRFENREGRIENSGTVVPAPGSDQVGILETRVKP